MSTLKLLLPAGVLLIVAVLAAPWALSDPRPDPGEPFTGNVADTSPGKARQAPPQAQPLPQRPVNPQVEAVRSEDFAALVDNLDDGWSPMFLDGGTLDIPEVLFKACLVNRRLGKLCELIREMPEAEQARTARQVFDEKFEEAWRERREAQQNVEEMSNNERISAAWRWEAKVNAVCAGLFLVVQFCPAAELVECLERNEREGVHLRLEPLFVLNLYVLTLVEKLNAGTIDDVLARAMGADVEPLRTRVKVVRTEDLKAHGLEGRWSHELTPEQRKAVQKTLAEVEGPLSSEQKLARAESMVREMKREQVPWFEWDTDSDLSNIMRPGTHASADEPGVIRMYEVCTTWHSIGGSYEDRRPILESLHNWVRAEIADQ